MHVQEHSRIETGPEKIQEEVKATESEGRRGDGTNGSAPEDISVLRVQCLEGRNKYLSTLEEYKAVEAEIEDLKEENERTYSSLRSNYQRQTQRRS